MRRQEGQEGENLKECREERGGEEERRRSREKECREEREEEKRTKRIGM